MNTTRNMPLTLTGVGPAPAELPTNIPLHNDWMNNRQFLDTVICQVIVSNAMPQHQHPMNYFVNVFVANNWQNDDMLGFTSLVYGYFSCLAAQLPVAAPIMDGGNQIKTDHTVQSLFDFYIGYRFNSDVNTLLVQYSDIINRISAAVNSHYDSLSTESQSNAIASYVSTINMQHAQSAIGGVGQVGVQLPGSMGQTSNVSLPTQAQPMQSGSGSGGYWDAVTPKAQPVPRVEPKVAKPAPIKTPVAKPFLPDGSLNFNYANHNLNTDTVDGEEVSWGLLRFDDSDNLLVNLTDLSLLEDSDTALGSIYRDYPSACSTNRRRNSIEDHIEELPIGYIETAVGNVTPAMLEPNTDLDFEYFTIGNSIDKEKELVALFYKKLTSRSRELGAPTVVATHYLNDIDDLASWLAGDVDRSNTHLISAMCDFIGDFKVVRAHDELLSERATLAFKQYWEVYNCLEEPLNPFSRPWGMEKSQHELAEVVFGKHWEETLDLEGVHYIRLGGRDQLIYNAKDPMIDGFISKYISANPHAVRYPYVQSNISAKNIPDYYLINSYEGDIYIEKVYLEKGDVMELERHFGEYKKNPPVTEQVKEVTREAVEDFDELDSRELVVLNTGAYGLNNNPVEIIGHAESIAKLTEADGFYSGVSATFADTVTHLTFNTETSEFHNRLCSAKLTLEDVRHRIMAAREEGLVDDNYLDLVDRLMVQGLNDYSNFVLATNSVVISKTFVEELLPMLENIAEELSPNEYTDFIKFGQTELVSSILNPMDKAQLGAAVKRIREDIKADKLNGAGKLEVSVMAPKEGVVVTQEQLDDWIKTLNPEYLDGLMVDGEVDPKLAQHQFLLNHGQLERKRTEESLTVNNLVGFSQKCRVVRTSATLDSLGLDKCYEARGTVRATFRFKHASSVLPSTWINDLDNCAKEFVVTKEGNLLQVYRNHKQPDHINLKVV